MKTLLIVPILCCLAVHASCAAPDIVTTKPPEEVMTALGGYYADKYPAYAELRGLSELEDLTLEERMRKSDELRRESPVSQIINSFPGRPLVTFSERTKTAEGKASVTRVDVYPEKDGSSRITVETKPAKAEGGQAFAETEPVSAAEIRKSLE